jgi:hypothetical protein
MQEQNDRLLRSITLQTLVDRNMNRQPRSNYAI